MARDMQKPTDVGLMKSMVVEPREGDGYWTG